MDNEDNKKEKQLNLDILKNIEVLSNRVNSAMAKGTKSVFSRYPLTFTLLILFGVIAVSEGMKGIWSELPFFYGHPWRLVITGLVILLATGTLYKKLDK